MLAKFRSIQFNQAFDYRNSEVLMVWSLRLELQIAESDLDDNFQSLVSIQLTRGTSFLFTNLRLPLFISEGLVQKTTFNLLLILIFKILEKLELFIR